ncbi:uncharacterized protein MAM_01160 [Metarhizium album ARSEF 1941]|uniref:IDI-2 n=1 Tax=Metarhizium album (strain ARSEF 1941) TaxID=1081103 RepID=A0A0B2WW22_METAS|nr:uncharacterized protein MAM_01160 [Metarhizium album ARSEF 1941]KHO00382.1 hypothetical protein MAM_01160 [Metarhizium album ARSEF 1941]
MRLLKAVALAIVYAQGARSAPTDLEQECGSLGVMKVDPAMLPEGVDPSRVRKCLDHPEGPGYGYEGEKLFERACWDRKIRSRGCSRSGYCWRSCDTPSKNYWCWAADDLGFGDWIRCSSDEHCSDPTMACAWGKCDGCGCSC